MMKTSIKRMKSWKNRMAQWLSIVLIHCSLFTATSCIEPPLYLPAEEVLVEMPIVIMDMEIVWNVDVDWKTQWLYGWDVIDEEISGSINYPMPTNYEVRRYYLGSEPNRPHTREGMDGFTIFAPSFRRTYNFGYYDLLLWSKIDSPTGTQVLLVDDSSVDEVYASTTATRGMLNEITGASSPVTGLYNQPEIFYSAYEQNIYISRYPEDYDYFDEEQKVWVKCVNTSLTPLVYIYLVQVILHHNDGRVVGVTGDAAVSAFASSTNVNTGHTGNRPCMVYFPMRMKQGIDYRDEKVDVIGGKLTTFGLCDMDGWRNNTRAEYMGTRTDLENKLYLTMQFSNGQEKTFNFPITEQCRSRAHGGVITIELDARELDIPTPGNPGSKNLFVPNLEDYENIDYDIPM